VYATHCIELIGENIKVVDLSNIKDIRAIQMSNLIVFTISVPEQKIQLTLESTRANEKQLTACASLLRASMLAVQRADWEWLSSRNPIGDIDSALGHESPTLVIPLQPLIRPTFSLLSALTAVSVSVSRTTASDAAVVRELAKSPSSSSWQWYIDNKGIRADEAVNIWLPDAVRAEDEVDFQAAIANGSSGALRAYLQRRTLHADEVRDTHLPEAVLREAVASRSIARLRAFQREFSDGRHQLLRDQASHEISTIYEEALNSLQLQIPGKDKELLRYFGRLFAWLSNSDDGKVEVVFSPPVTADLAAIDRLYQRTYGPKCGVVASLEANFGLGALTGSQEKVFGGLVRSFQQIVSNEALTLVKAETATPNRPAINVTYTVTSSGSIFVETNESNNENKTVCYIGTRIKFNVVMTIPNEHVQYAFVVNVLPPDHFEVSETSTAWMPTHSSVSANRVYNIMTGLAFERLAEGIRRRMFSPESPAYEEMFDILDIIAQ
jgi:hypothetical protein